MTWEGEKMGVAETEETILCEGEEDENSENAGLFDEDWVAPV